MPVIRDLIAAGINVNVTLLFSPERYRAVARAYMDGLRTRAERGQPLAAVASVASFFLSRIDTAVDKLLDALAARGQPAARTLRGKAAIASACRAFEVFEELTRERGVAGARGAGARGRSDCCGLRPPPRTPLSAPSSTSRNSSCPAPSTRCRWKRSTPTDASGARSCVSSAISPTAVTRARDSSDWESILRAWRSNSSARASPSSSSRSTNCKSGSKTSARAVEQLLRPQTARQFCGGSARG